MVEAGSQVFGEGEAATGLLIVLEGRVCILKTIEAREARLALLGPGDLLGELATLAGQPHEASARAETDCRLLQIEADLLPELLAGHPEIAQGLLRRLASRLHEARLAAAATGGEAGAGAPRTGPPGRPRALQAPRLLHEASGKEFPLSAEGDSVLGRSAPRSPTTPDVDLSNLDPERSLSRSHARISPREGGFQVAEEPGVKNGTLVNGNPVRYGTPVPLADGAELRLGRVRLIFRLS